MEGERVSDMDGWAVDRSRLTERSQVDGGPEHTLPSSTSCLVCLIDDERTSWERVDLRRAMTCRSAIGASLCMYVHTSIGRYILSTQYMSDVHNSTGDLGSRDGRICCSLEHGVKQQ
jgi:hypothetical protein